MHQKITELYIYVCMCTLEENVLPKISHKKNRCKQAKIDFVSKEPWKLK